MRPRPRASLAVLAVAATLTAAVGFAGFANAANAAAPPPAAPATAGNTVPNLAPTPPMGFNDWAKYGCSINEDLFVKTADAIVAKGLDKLGYNYVNVDDCWMLHDRDAAGNLQVDTARFPHGMKWLGDYIHRKGLKFGTYEDAGYQTCQGAAGSYGHFQQDANLYASWGVDYLKLDYCYQPLDAYPGKSPADVAKIVYTQASDAIKNSGRPMVFSESAPAYYCCSGSDFQGIMSWIADEGQLWRFGSDIYDAWPSVIENYNEGNTPGLPAHGGPNHWNDADMLEAGNPGMTLTEQQSQLTLWSEMASPLLLSTDLTTLSPEALGIVSNRDVIAVDQDRLGAQGTIVQSANDADVLSRPLANGDRAVVLFNKSDKAQTVTTDAKTAGLTGHAPYLLRDLVSKQATASDGVISANLAPHATVMYRISGNADEHLAPSTTLSLSSKGFTAGTPNPVTVAFANNGTQSADHIDLRLAVPTGWTVTPASQPLPHQVEPGGSASATFWVTATPPPPGRSARTLTATADYRYLGSRVATTSGQETDIEVTPYPNLAAAFNNVGATDDTNTGQGNFDGGGNSFSTQALGKAGATAGGTVTHNGVNFSWPTAAAGTPDNVAGGGAEITMSGKGGKLHFLGSEAGAVASSVTVTYSDGSSTKADLGFPNWCCTDKTAYGAEPAVITNYRNTPAGPANVGTAYDVFYNSIPLDATKTVAQVTLPDDPAIHIFAVTVQ